MEFLDHTLWSPRGTLRSGSGVCRKVIMEESRKSLQKQPRDVARLVVAVVDGRGDGAGWEEAGKGSRACI